MESIRYFDTSISRKVSQIIRDGEVVTVQDLVDAARLSNVQTFREENFISDFRNLDIDPLGATRTQRWEAAVRTMMYALSGQIPDRLDVLKGRQIIQMMSKTIKKELDSNFALSFLPYLLIGFKIGQHDRDSKESNRLSNAVSLIENTYLRKEIHSTSFLCSHREATNVKPMSLIESVVSQKVKKSLNLQCGMFSNTRAENVNILLRQQQATEMSCSNMFPDVFENYMKNGNIADMLLLLDSHFCEMSHIASDMSTKELTIKMEGLDEFSAAVNMHVANQSDHTATVSDISQLYTEASIARLKPYYGKESTEDSVKKDDELIMRNLERAKVLEESGAQLSNDKSLSETTIRSINWFLDARRKSFNDKALYETTFYFTWGQMLKNQGGVGVGIDRDFLPFQAPALAYGYQLNAEGSAPILYARRCEKEKAGEKLTDISFRQFWR